MWSAHWANCCTRAANSVKSFVHLSYEQAGAEASGSERRWGSFHRRAGAPRFGGWVIQGRFWRQFRTAAPQRLWGSITSRWPPAVSGECLESKWTQPWSPHGCRVVRAESTEGFSCGAPNTGLMRILEAMTEGAVEDGYLALGDWLHWNMGTKGSCFRLCDATAPKNVLRRLGSFQNIVSPRSGYHEAWNNHTIRPQTCHKGQCGQAWKMTLRRLWQGKKLNPPLCPPPYPRAPSQSAAAICF